MTELLAAILAVQAEAPKLPKDKTAKVRMKAGGEYTYQYTDLATVVEKVGPKLVEHGLVWMTLPVHGEDGAPALYYRLAHVDTGEDIAGTMPLMLAGAADSQALGSAITYARRYALCSVLNLVADDDDDGNAAASSAPAGRVAQSGPPSEKQLDYLKSLIGREKPSMDVLRALLGRVEADGVDPSVPGWSKALNKGQVSQLIETFKNGVVPVGGSDIPSDLDPVPEPEDDGSPLPFDAVGAEHES